MELRAANKMDLPALDAMFRNIVGKMHENGLMIWNEFYPYEAFAGDIENEALFLITHQDEILAAFGVSNAAEGQERFEWKNKSAKAVYLVRVGVNARVQRQGLGGLVVKHALDITKQRNAEFLRLLVVDENETALNLYRKNGFTQVAGAYAEFSASLNKTIRELGFEKAA